LFGLKCQKKNYLCQQPVSKLSSWDKSCLATFQSGVKFFILYYLGCIQLTLFWNKNKQNIAYRFFFGVKCRTISQQHFVGKRWCKSSLYSDNIKIRVNVIFRRKHSQFYSGIRSIERTLSLGTCYADA